MENSQHEPTGTQQRLQPGDWARVVGGDHHGEKALIVAVSSHHAGWAKVAYKPDGGGLVHSADLDGLTPLRRCATCEGEGFVDAD